jgi:prepilin-type N-terminal cleavage/methylation domain-containing protein
VKQSRSERRGFSLVELMVVIAIGTIIAAMAGNAVRNIVKARRVSTEVRSIIAEIIDLRVLAISRGLPTGLCFRLPTYVNATNAKNNDPGGRTQFVKSSTTARYLGLTQAEAALITASDKTSDYHYLPSYGPTKLLYTTGNNVTAATVTVMFDADGILTIWQGSDCTATDKLLVTPPVTLGVAQSDNATTPASLQISSDGSAVVYP